MSRATLKIDVEFDPDVTDAESVAAAADTLLKTALSLDALDEYGGPRFEEFLVVEEEPDDDRDRRPVSRMWRGIVLPQAWNHGGHLFVRLRPDGRPPTSHVAADPGEAYLLAELVDAVVARALEIMKEGEDMACPECEQGLGADHMPGCSRRISTDSSMVFIKDCVPEADERERG